MSRSRSSPITTRSRDGTRTRSEIARSAAREGFPTTTGRAPVTFAIAAVSIAPRLKIGPSAPA